MYVNSAKTCAILISTSKRAIEARRSSGCTTFIAASTRNDRLSWANRKMLRIAAALIFLFPCTAAAQENSVYQQLVGNGVPLSNGKTVLLPPPMMADGLNAADQLAVLKNLVAPEQLSDFLAGRVSSPYVLVSKINDVAGSKPTDSVGHRIDLYYIAGGSLATVGTEGFVRQQLGQGQNNQIGAAQFYTDDELKDRNLTVVNTSALRERYAHAEILLFGQLKVTGTGHCMRATTPDSVLFDFLLDQRLLNDPTYPNQWQRGRSDKSGKVVFDKPQPYTGAGAYLKVTRLQEPAGLQNQPQRVFVEYHLVFDEPNGWFGGGNNLLAKLPNRFEADVRKFREDLRDYEKKLAAGRTAPSPQSPAIPPMQAPADVGNK